MSMLGLGDLFHRKDPLARVFDEMDHDIHRAVEETFDGDLEVEVVEEVDLEELPDIAFDEEEASAPDALTLHAQTRLAAFRAFEAAHRAAREELVRFGQSFSAIATDFNRGREFLEDCGAEIERSSELEVANGRLSAHNRKLTERIDKLERVKERYDALVETSKQRENRLLQEIETLREMVSEARLETSEARKAAAMAENMRNDLQMKNSSQGSDIERLHREIESLREKNVLLSGDIDRSHQKAAEHRRKLEEMQAALAADATRINEMTARLSAEEMEVARLEKQRDAMELRLQEITETAQVTKQEMADKDRQSQFELQALRSEAGQANARLQSVLLDLQEKTNLVALLEGRVSERDAENRILDQKLRAFTDVAEPVSTTIEAPIRPANADLARQTRELEAVLARAAKFNGRPRAEESVDLEKGRLALA